MPLRSRLLRSHQRRGVPPVGLLCHWACTSIAVFRDGWSAFSRHGQTIEGISALSLPWHHPCSLQDVSVPNLVLQGDPQDVTNAMLLKRLQLTNVMLGHSPCLCSIEEHRQHQGPEDAYFSGNTLVTLCLPSLVLLTLLVPH